MPELIVRKWDGPYSFMVFRESGVYKARRGDTGEIQFQDPELHEVLNDVWNALTPGRTWKERVILKGEFIIDSPVGLVSHLFLDLSQAKIVNNVGGVLFSTGSAKSNIEIVFGEIDSQGAYGTPLALTGVSNITVRGGYLHDINVSPGGYGLYFEECDYVRVENVRIVNVNERDGIQFKGCQHVWVVNPYIENATLYGIDCHASDTPRNMADVHIIAPKIVNCGKGIDIADGDYWVVEVPIIRNISDMGIDLRGNLNYVVIVSPQIYNTGVQGILDYYAGVVNFLRIIGGTVNTTTGTDTDCVFLKKSPGAFIMGLEARNAVRDGFYIENDEVTLIGIRSIGHGRHGVFLNGDYCKVLDGTIKDNGNRGIIEYTGHDYNIIKNNHLTNNAVGNIYTVGANTIVRDNISY